MRATLLVLFPLGLLLVRCKQNDTELQVGQLVTGITVGGTHACALVVGGSMRCFGDDGAGQLGDGEGALDAGTSHAVVGLISVADIAAGYAHTCAKLEGSAMRCWGANDFGQLGDGTTVARTTPAVLSLNNVYAIAAGGAHTCAVLNDRTVVCWGRNDNGQLGDGSTTHRSLPVPVTGLVDVEELAAGQFHTCARLKDSTVRCWGRNDAGQIGDGTIATPRYSPALIPALRDVKSISAGLADTCAATNRGEVLCWGRGNARSSPTAVSGFVEAEEVSLAATPAVTELCARFRDHSVRCATAFGTTPRALAGILNAVDIAAGGFGTCARSSNGALRCWQPGKDASSVVL